MKKYYPDGSLVHPFNVYAYAVAAKLYQVLKQAGATTSRVTTS